MVIFAGSPKMTLSDGLEETSSNSNSSSNSKPKLSSMIEKDGSMRGAWPAGNVTIKFIGVRETTIEEGCIVGSV